MEGRWERRASEQLKIRGEKHGGRRLRRSQNGRNTSRSLLLRKYKSIFIAGRLQNHILKAVVSFQAQQQYPPSTVYSEQYSQHALFMERHACELLCVQVCAHECIIQIYCMDGGGVCYTQVCLHHFITLYVNFHGSWKVGGVGRLGGGARNGQSEKGRRKKRKRCDDRAEGAVFVHASEGKLITRWSPTPLKC